jgi:hypothetical protein
MSTPVNVIFALVFDGDVPDVCDEASSHGLLTSEYVWIDGQGLSTQPLPSTVNRSQTGLCLNGWLQIASTLPTAGYSRYEAAWAQAVVADCANEVFTPPSNIFTAAAPDLGVYEYDAAAAMILALDSVTTAQETDGDAVRAAVAVLDFEGASGRMKFEASLDRDVTTAEISILNLVYHLDTDSLEFRVVRTFTNSYLQVLEIADILWVANSTKRPLDLTTVVPDHNQNFLDSFLQTLCVALSCTSIAMAVVLILWTLLYRKHEAVKPAQPILMILIAVGVIFSLIATIPLTKVRPRASKTGSNCPRSTHSHST